jgi:hypothetical protein
MIAVYSQNIQNTSTVWTKCRFSVKYDGTYRPNKDQLTLRNENMNSTRLILHIQLLLKIKCNLPL